MFAETRVDHQNLNHVATLKRISQCVLLIRAYNGHFFFKTTLKIWFFLLQTSPRWRPFFWKNQIYTAISDFFFSKNEKMAIWSATWNPPYLTFFQKNLKCWFQIWKIWFFGIFYTFLDKFFGLYYSGENFLADIIGANENQKKHWYYRREWTVAFLADFRWRFFFLTGSFFITTLTTWLKNLTQQKEK